MLTRDELMAALDYDPDTGLFTRGGKLAGRLNSGGYRQIMVRGRRYVASRLAWLWMTGGWPENQVDHRDGDRDNNRWHNLRAATNAQNQQNRARNKNNTHGVAGVHYRKDSNRWAATVGRKHIGYAATLEEAAAMRAAAKAAMHTFNPGERHV